MAIELWGFQGTFYLGLPQRPFGTFVLALYALALLGLLLAARRRPPVSRRTRSGRDWLVFAVLVLASPLASELILIRLPIAGAPPAPGVPAQAAGAAFSLLGAVPWMLAAGLMGEWQALIVGLVGGLTRGGWETNSLLTPMQTALTAVVVAWLVRRDYVEWPGRILRNPLASGIAGGLLLGLFRGLEVFAYSGGAFYDGLDYTLSRLGAVTAAALLEVGAAAIAAEFVRRRGPGLWFRPARLVAGPYNRSLVARLLVVIVGLGLVAGTVLVYGDWALARSAAQDLTEAEMARAATQAGDGIPYFAQVGRSLLGGLADRLGSVIEAGDLLSFDLESQIRAVPFFRQLAVFGTARELLTLAPSTAWVEADLPLEFEAAMGAALEGVPQEVVLLPRYSVRSTELVFLWPISSPESGATMGVVAGWTTLDANPVLQPVVRQLAGLTPGEGFVIDDQGIILIHSDPDRLGQSFVANDGAAEGAYPDRAPDGTYRLVYAYTVDGYPWRVVVTMPQREVQTLAMQIAVRLVGVVLAVGLGAVVAVYLTSRRLTQPLRTMASAAESMARGSLSPGVEITGEDEIGRLAASFERMRRSLKSRLDEMDLLLSASRQVASSFDLQQVLPPILAGVQELTAADMARLVLAGKEEEQGAEPEAYHAGEDPGEWKALDGQVLELCRRRGRFVLENPSRARAVLNLKALETPIEALMAVPLRNEEQFVGALWLGHRAPHAFTNEEIGLISILAAQLGVSVANARLYLEAEQERLRLRAILSATPDAVLVIDGQGRILLANPAAEVVLRGEPGEARGKPAADWVTVADVVRLLSSPGGETRTAEVMVGGGRVMFASVSDIGPGGSPSPGRVCILADITHYKKIDMLKSEFVSTVSHDLRAPLTLMHGYATMLSMVGDLSDKQGEFVHKILSSVEVMSKLVDNVLDLGRIEAGVGLSIESVRVETVVRDVVGSYRPQAANKQITLEVDLREGMEPIEADPTLLRQAVANLVDNALKYTPAGGRVGVRAVQQDGQQLICVEDSGLGIAPADQARMFEKFYRARKREALREKGSGLGLAIVKSIAEQHGGRVSVESRLGAGSTFTLELPLRQAGQAELLPGQGSRRDEEA